MLKYFVLFCVLMFPSVSLADHDDSLMSKSEIYWLSQNIYHEARGEDPYGQLMVGFVTLERLRSGKWGNTIKEVVTAKHQFSWYWDGKSDIPTDPKAWEKAKQIALFSIMVHQLFGTGELNYYHSKEVQPYWSSSFEKYLVIGNHIFYKEKEKK